jgi:hypothetical protein
MGLVLLVVLVVAHAEKLVRLTLVQPCAALKNLLDSVVVVAASSNVEL